MQKKNKLSFKKRYLLLLFPLCLLSYCVYGEVTKEARQKKFLEHPPNVRQVWPSSTNPNGMVLNIPATYIDGSTFIFEPILKDEEEKKRKERFKEGKEETCDVYTCQELFEMLLPDYEPINLKNRHIFKQSTKNDADEYYKRSLRLNIVSWNEIPKKVQNPNFSIPESILNQRINSLFHVKKIFLNNEVMNFVQIKNTDNLDLIEVVGVSTKVPGGIYNSVVEKEPGKKYSEDTIEDPQHHKIFFHKENEKIVTMITCSSQTSLTTSEKLVLFNKPLEYRCEHNFDIPELSLNISAYYNAEYLSEWVNIEKNITNLFKTFQEHK